MGQSVQIVRQRTLSPGVVRFEIDRSLTATSHETYSADVDIDRHRPSDLLASRLFATGRVREVHVFSNIITVSGDGIEGAVEIEDVLRNLFIHYLPGVMPTAVQ